MRHSPSLTVFLQQILQDSYGINDLNIQHVVINLDFIHLFRLKDLKETLFVQVAYMDLKYLKCTARFSTRMLYSEAVVLRKDLENVQKAEAPKQSAFEGLLEL